MNNVFMRFAVNIYVFIVGRIFRGDMFCTKHVHTNDKINVSLFGHLFDDFQSL